MFTPRGYYTNNSYIGFMPDGSRMRFPTSQEYLEYEHGFCPSPKSGQGGVDPENRQSAKVPGAGGGLPRQHDSRYGKGVCFKGKEAP